MVNVQHWKVTLEINVQHWKVTLAVNVQHWKVSLVVNVQRWKVSLVVSVQHWKVTLVVNGQHWKVTLVVNVQHWKVTLVSGKCWTLKSDPRGQCSTLKSCPRGQCSMGSKLDITTAHMKNLLTTWTNSQGSDEPAQPRSFDSTCNAINLVRLLQSRSLVPIQPQPHKWNLHDGYLLHRSYYIFWPLICGTYVEGRQPTRGTTRHLYACMSRGTSSGQYFRPPPVRVAHDSHQQRLVRRQSFGRLVYEVLDF